MDSPRSLMLSANVGASAVAMSAQVLSYTLDQIMIILRACVKCRGRMKNQKTARSAYPTHPAGDEHSVPHGGGGLLFVFALRTPRLWVRARSARRRVHLKARRLRRCRPLPK